MDALAPDEPPTHSRESAIGLAIIVVLIAAAILVAAVAAFGHADLNVLGLACVGLGCWCGATVVPRIP
jgi:hypothetical protein